MYAYFRSVGKRFIKGQLQNFMVGLLFADKEVETSCAKKHYDWEIDRDIKELLLENIEPVVQGESEDKNLTISMDFNFLIRSVEFNEEFLKNKISEGDFNAISKSVMSVTNDASTKMINQILEQQTVLEKKNLRINTDKVFKLLVRNHNKKELWLNYKSTDEHGNKIEFYAPYGESEVEGLSHLERYN